VRTFWQRSWRRVTRGLASGGRMSWMPYPPRPKDGSGKFGTPWVRMQWALATNACFWASDSGAVGPVEMAGLRCGQKRWAAAGDAVDRDRGGATDRLPDRETLAAGPGRRVGEVRDVVRAHALCNREITVADPVAVARDVLEDPHAATASAQPSTAITGDMYRLGRALTAVLVAARSVWLMWSMVRLVPISRPRPGNRRPDVRAGLLGLLEGGCLDVVRR
jgi:hypothetical protein